jgi:putative tryptophan/tyrosine transport system substrate-binding protein
MTGSFLYRRREFMLAVGGAAAWPLAARAQPGATPVIGLLNSGAPEPFKTLVAAFREGLAEGGYVEGQNVAIEYRWAEGAYDRLSALAADLVRRQVAVILAAAPPAVQAAKAATSTIPIVFIVGGNPVELGFVSSLNRPGANVTGVSFLVNELGAKRLALLHELLPSASSIGFLTNPSRPSSDLETKGTKQGAQVVGAELHVLNASTEGEIDAALAEFARRRVNAVLVGTDPFFLSRRDQLIALTARLAIPSMFNLREYVVAGGLMSYAPSVTHTYRQAGVYVAKILKGVKPADLPVIQPTKFELVINLKTAKALGLEVPPMLLALADEVIE